ncbi:MAG: hypothetical protein ABIH41_06410 [Nanoarchaeota archaeon]
MATVDDLLTEMSSTDLLLALIMAKPGEVYFKESELEDSIRKATAQYPSLGKFFYGHCDGTPEHGNVFDDALAWGLTWGQLTFTGDFQHTYLRNSWRPHVDERLKERYGADYSARLAEVVERVWAPSS